MPPCSASWHSESHSPVPVASHSAQSHLMAPYNISHNKSWHLLNKHGTDLIQIWQADYHDTKVHFGQKKKKKKKKKKFSLGEKKFKKKEKKKKKNIKNQKNLWVLQNNFFVSILNNSLKR